MSLSGLAHRDVSDFRTVSYVERQILPERLSTTKSDMILFSIFCSSPGFVRSPTSVTRYAQLLAFSMNSIMLIMHFGREFQQEGVSPTTTLSSLCFDLQFYVVSSKFCLFSATILFSVLGPFFRILAIFRHHTLFYVRVGNIHIVAFFETTIPFLRTLDVSAFKLELFVLSGTK